MKPTEFEPSLLILKRDGCTYALTKPGLSRTMKAADSEEGEKARRVCPQRAGVRCEPAENPRDTGSGAFRLRGGP